MENIPDLKTRIAADKLDGYTVVPGSGTRLGSLIVVCMSIPVAENKHGIKVAIATRNIDGMLDQCDWISAISS